jgi:hypothetical protein
MARERNLVCGLSHSVGIVAKVADFGANEQGLCEIFMKGFQKGSPSSYVLRSRNMMNSPEVLDSLKFTGLPKIRKWWDALSSEHQELCEGIVRKVSLLLPAGIDRMRIYMLQYERTQVLNLDSSIVDREFSSSVLEDEVIKEGLSYFSERPQNIFKLTTTPATTIASGSKRKNLHECHNLKLVCNMALRVLACLNLILKKNQRRTIKIDPGETSYFLMEKRSCPW